MVIPQIKEDRLVKLIDKSFTSKDKDLYRSLICMCRVLGPPHKGS